ncbi:sulfatase [uncultured Parabacteroides sp.]|uniref:sulfatase family protein n=1 Tax=uncultured Parabacteroides sp. TaxID=512312 RepID=UPI0025960046|nr:sulfatase [uncultured Parabacteroides sp.]
MERFKWIATLSLLSMGQAIADEQPNVLIIHTDEHSFRTLGCYREFLPDGQASPWGEKCVVETPNIDYIAKQGVLFTRCYATTPVSSPSRASFMTGLYPQNAGVYTNDMVLNEQALTFGEIFRRHGYETGYIGKLHLNGVGRPEWHPTRDFGFTDNRYMYNRGHWKKVVGMDEEVDFDQKAKIQTTDSLSFTTDFLTNRAIEFIEQHKEKPFCCMLSLPDPHGPNLVRTPYDNLYASLSFDRPASSRKDTTGLPAWSHGNGQRGDRMENMVAYFGMVKCIDDNIGRLLKALRDNGILNNTIIVFTSDHGDLCGEHGLVNKGVPLDGSARVPFIISYPVEMAKGLKVDNVMSVVDFTPSLLSFCGMESPMKYEGRDLSVLWKGKALPANLDDAVFMRAITSKKVNNNANRAMWVSVVTSRYKLTLSENVSDTPWLTDMEKDPDELVNCYGDPNYRETVVWLKKKLIEYGTRFKDPRIRNSKIEKELMDK